MSTSDAALDVKQRRLVAVAAFTANGDLAKLRTTLGQALDAGWTVNELKEVLVQLYAYAGFPRSLNALDAFATVIDERQRRGISDAPGREPSPLPTDKTSVQLGTEIQATLVGGPVSGRFVTFAPAVDTFLKGHLFGDIFGRDNLDVQSREIATVSALATLEHLDPQLSSHFNVALNTGLTEPQLRSLTAVLDAHVGKARGDNARAVLAQALRKRQASPPSHATIDAGAVTQESATIAIRRVDASQIEGAPPEHFTGVARIQRVFAASDPGRASGAYVTFERGARTAWHAHPLGQTLIVTSGVGLVQQWGHAVQVIHEGEVVSIPPGVKHWHGASATSAMTHLAIQEQRSGTSVAWFESVSDAQYRSP